MLPGHSARLLSTELRGSAVSQCLQFYYHMYGSGTGLLSLYLRREEGSHHPREALLWRRHGEQSISWMLGMVDYTCEDRHQVSPTNTFSIQLTSDQCKRAPQNRYPPIWLTMGHFKGVQHNTYHSTWLTSGQCKHSH